MIRDTEYVVNEFDEYGDIIDQRYYPTLAEARADFDTASSPAEIEKWRNTWNPTDMGLKDRSFETIFKK